MYNLGRSKDAPDLHAAHNMDVLIKSEPLDDDSFAS